MALAIIAEGKSACKIAFCRVCLVVFKQNTGQGRKRKFCRSCSRVQSRSPLTRKCISCSSMLQKGERKRCRVCQISYEKQQRPFWNKVKTSHQCKHCGIEFYPKKNDRLKYCSRECSWAEQKRNSAERIEKINTDRLNKKIVIEQARLNRQASSKLHKCFCCGIEFDRSKRKFKHTCSDECQSVKEQTSKQKSRKSIRDRFGGGKYRHRARKFGVSYEPVNRLKVFERDGWRCQICHRPTPKKLCGSFDDRAPELDHIVPLSKGGEHSYRNVQCACRKCNGAKSDSVYGQLYLFVV